MIFKFYLPDISLSSEIFNYEYFLNSDVCRLCWTRNAEREISPKELFNENEELIEDFADKIRYCLDLDVNDVIFPKRICNNCEENINSVYAYKIFCKESDRNLREIISIDKSESINVKVEKQHDLEIEVPLKSELEDLLESICSSVDTDDEKLISKKNIKNRRKISISKKIKKNCKRTPTYCNICRLDYETRENLIKHNKTSHGIEDGGYFKCFGCDKRFKSRKTRLGHETKFCKGMKEGYKCSLCDRFLPKRRIYEAHVRDHRRHISVQLPDELFKCRICDETFRTRSLLQQHVDVHKTPNNFVCEVCGRVFSRQDYLHKHILTHTGLKRYSCPHCNFRATQKSSLTVHIRKHTGERPFSCDLCSLRCVSSSNLRAHRRRHTGIKSFECSVCHKKFGYKISLEEHLASVHEKLKSHTCGICGATYSRERGLKRHMRAKHNKSISKNIDIEDPNVYSKNVSESVILEFTNPKNDAELLKTIKNDNFLKALRINNHGFVLKEAEEFSKSVDTQNSVYVM